MAQFDVDQELCPPQTNCFKRRSLKAETDGYKRLDERLHRRVLDQNNVVYTGDQLQFHIYDEDIFSFQDVTWKQLPSSFASDIYLRKCGYCTVSYVHLFVSFERLYGIFCTPLEIRNKCLQCKALAKWRRWIRSCGSRPPRRRISRELLFSVSI